MTTHAEPRTVREALPEPGQLVRLRSRASLVEEVVPPAGPSEQTLVRLSCLDDDAQGADVKRQLAAGRRHAERRLAEMERERATELVRIRRSLEVRATRLVPVGLAYLRPVSR